MLGFETLTLAPIDRRLIDPALMTPDEIAWLDAYHAEPAGDSAICSTPSERAWLAAATRPLLTRLRRSPASAAIVARP